jgi:heme exporter protein C
MQITMQHTLLIMTIACWCYAIAVVLARVRSIILERERKTDWISELPEVRS